MSAKPSSVGAVPPKANENSVEQRRLDLVARESPELVIAFGGAIGCGMPQVVEQTRNLLRNARYSVELIKISKLIEKLALEDMLLSPDDDLRPNSPKRYELLQTAGNRLRSKYSDHVLAELAISRILAYRNVEAPAGAKMQAKPRRVAYLIDQLKHPSEVKLLRSVYGNLFYLIGVFASERQRKLNLRETMDAVAVQRAMDRDRKEEEEDGQQLDKTLRLADLFVRNSPGNRVSTDRQLERLLELMHGKVGQTPTKDEYAMYAAYAAGLRSACLSRQVGAAITDASGNIISTGCNDVPKFGGGLYTVDDDKRDARCVNWKDARCWNDHHKELLKNEISAFLGGPAAAEIIKDALPMDADVKLIDEVQAALKKSNDKLARVIARESRLKDLLEFSRAVHAEMDAITALAREGGRSTDGGKLFTTTFPCHNCARHIVAAGIREVYYIEPYEKSLALDLHHDAIVGEAEDSSAEEGGRVRFLHFEGISPRQYQRLFLGVDRKEGGKARSWDWGVSRQGMPQYLDSYQDLELRVLNDLGSRGLSADKLAKLT